MWVTRVDKNADARLRLVCFPYAGSGAWAFRRWGELSPVVEVCAIELPGRGTRMAEPPVRSAAALVPLIARGLEAHLDLPFAFFGHSMGAMLAFEVARHLRRESRVAPLHLFVSGREAPQLADDGPRYHGLPDDELTAVLRELNGTPAEVLDNADLMRLMLPVVRADLEVSETYRYAIDAPLDCPITAFGGRRDASVRSTHLDAWREQTTAVFALRLFEGDHFFLHQAAAPLLRALAHDLERYAGRP
ncbi:MAG: alpha/beta fold hydrolase [Gemmatimonadaceae bacterium]